MIQTRNIQTLIFLLFMFAVRTPAAEILAASTARDDVVIAIGAASDGDIVRLPVGTNVWDAEIPISKAVRLIGTTNSTEIVDGLTSSQSLLDFTQTSGAHGVLGIRFKPGARTQKYSSGTILTRDGNGDATTFELAACVFDGVKNIAFRGGGWGNTRIHHCAFTNVSNTIWFWNEQWGGDVHGDGSWTEPVTWGGTNGIVVEYCTFVNSSMDSITDTYAGARVIFRLNEIINGNFATHGSRDGSGRRPGPPQIEIYVNNFTANPPSTKNAIHIRGGPGLCWSNNFKGFNKFLTLHYYGLYADHGSMGLADGRHQWDLMAFDDGAETPGGAGDGIYYAGVAGAGSTDNLLVVPGAGWTPGALVGLVVRVTNSAAYTRTNSNAAKTRFPPPENPNWQNYFSSLIVENTSTSLTVEIGTQNPVDKPFREGEVFEVVKVLLPLDGIGAGQRAYLADKSQYPAITNLNQKRWPWRIWGNLDIDSGSPAATVAEPGVWPDYVWFEQVAGFDGSTGMGVGNTAAMNAITPSSTNGISWFNDETYKVMEWSNSTWTVVADYSAFFGAGGGNPPDPPDPPPQSTNSLRRAQVGRVHAGQLTVP